MNKKSPKKISTYSEQARKNISIAQKLRFQTQSVWNKGLSMSEETKKKVSDAKKGCVSSMKGKKHKPESKEKMRLAKLGKKNIANSLKIGELNPRWIIDRSKLKKSEDRRLNVAYQYWAKQVKTRDGFKCKISNSDCKGRLEAHHILSWRKYPELRYDINNGISLCSHHHPKKYSEEERLSPYFKKLINTN